MNIGKSLKIALIDSGKKQNELAAEMGVSVNYISMISNNKKSVSLRTLSHIASLLGFKLSEFIALGEDK